MTPLPFLAFLAILLASIFLAYLFGSATRLGGKSDPGLLGAYNDGWQLEDEAAWAADRKAIESDWRSVMHWDPEDWEEDE